MGNRLSKIYTRTGDAGETGLADGSRISKDDALIHAQGDVDELNSILGLLSSQLQDGSIKDVVLIIQNDLFNLGAEISLSQVFINSDQVSWLESQLDELNKDLPALREFILPGGNETAALCHLARAVCRRAERQIVALAKTRVIGSDLCAYVNRLSDLLFVLARSMNLQDGGKEVYWNSDRLKND